MPDQPNKCTTCGKLMPDTNAAYYCSSECHRKALGLEEMPDYGELMPLDKFVQHVRHGEFVNYDGSGYYALDCGYSRAHPAIPSEIYQGEVDRSWTHVAWFNK